jgi:CTP:molybdopterin cytidylyltransferase MocA
VALADMPFVRRTSIAAVRDAIAGGAALAAPYFRARRGHPVGTSGAFFDELLAVRRRGRAPACRAERKPACHIDTPDDLAPALKV